MKRNLVLAFCSIHPQQYSKEIRKAREAEYLACLRQMIRVLPGSFDYLILENTVSNLGSIGNDALRDILSTNTFLVDGNKGRDGNIGVGELDMLTKAYEAGKLSGYDRIVYMTGRRLLTCPYIFEKTLRLDKPYRAILCNSDFVTLDGSLKPTEKKDMWGDIFFAMDYETIEGYIKFTDLEKMITEKYGSEQNLYRYVEAYKIKYEQIHWLGMIRNDWVRTGNPMDIHNFHIC